MNGEKLLSTIYAMQTRKSNADATGVIAVNIRKRSESFFQAILGSGVEPIAQIRINGRSERQMFPAEVLAKAVFMPTSCFAVFAISERSEWKKIIQPKPTMISE